MKRLFVTIHYRSRMDGPFTIHAPHTCICATLPESMNFCRICGVRYAMKSGMRTAYSCRGVEG